MNDRSELTAAQRYYVRRLEEKGRELNRRWTTVQAYRGHLIRYMLWIGRNIERVGSWSSEAKVSMYLRKLSVRDRVSPTTRNQAFCALLFFYKKVIETEPGVIEKIGAPAPLTDQTDLRRMTAEGLAQFRRGFRAHQK